ncbi:trigger factor [Breznakia sp. PF5-3]|uniref:trigger factor n=1 Tax=unclassified Breznakia TaxID=2623764 RepID=UPI002406A51D|nr:MULTISPECIES: trigger factor [unclassified Breznakia]MDF9824114.1 trigger factor [Breznakia sp. PM6-1]MDF9834912.1 trigger factor [Breznakia sp. PF5-3]MDF9837219.1 trigger factor [Breznakia sp. PFB2-8]MDF9859209.1 trigger factor [Breznakia sp. PH5-24]
MSSTWKLKENSQGELKVKVEGEKWLEAQKKAFKKLAKDIEVKGFRKGQVPESVAKKQISEQSILMEAIDEVAGHALQEGIEKHDLWIIARPELGVDEITKEAVMLKFNVTVKPEVKLGEYKGLDIKKDKVSVTAKEVNEQLEQLQARFSELVVKEDGVVKNGDTAVIDFEGFKDGVAFEGGKGENYPLEIGSGSFIPGFEEQLIGMKADEEKDLDITFPENYGAEDLAGKAVVFKVKIHEIKEKVLPEVNDDLIKDAEVKDVETVEDYKKYVKNNLKEQKENEVQTKFENDLLTKLVENAEVVIPQVMIDDEVSQMMNDFAQRLAGQGFNQEQYFQMTGTTAEQLQEQMQPEAKTKVNVRLVLDKIAEVEKVEISEKDVEVEYENIANRYGMEVSKVKEAINVDALNYDLRLQKAVEIVKDSVVNKK